MILSFRILSIELRQIEGGLRQLFSAILRNPEKEGLENMWTCRLEQVITDSDLSEHLVDMLKGIGIEVTIV